jgi:soluble lytic murein transglycosylase-like protein
VGRETQRRLALLAIVGSVAAAWAIAVRGPAVTVASAAAASTPPRAAVVRLAACPFPRNLRRLFESAASNTQVPPGMLYAVAKVESNLNQAATSSAGARGLLQLMPSTARSLNLNPDEARSNVLAGARYLRQLLDRFDSTDLALAAYNAGPTAVTVAGGAPSDDVVRYVDNVDQVWRSVAGCS